MPENKVLVSGHFFKLLMSQQETKRTTVERLKLYITLQLQAYERQDWEVYDRIEQKIRTLENRIVR